MRLPADIWRVKNLMAGTTEGHFSASFFDMCEKSSSFSHIFLLYYFVSNPFYFCLDTLQLPSTLWVIYFHADTFLFYLKEPVD